MSLPNPDDKLRFLANSIGMNLCNREASVVRPSVCLSVNFYTQVATSTTNMTRSPPNLHTTVPIRARIQNVLKVKVKVKGHVIRTVLWFHENRFFSQANGWNATKFAHDGSRPGVHPGCAQGQGRGTDWSKVTWYVHFRNLWCHEMFAIQYSLTFCLYMRSLYEVPLYFPTSISIRQLGLDV